MDALILEGFAPTSGGNRRAQRRKQARLYDGALPRMRPTSAYLARTTSAYVLPVVRTKTRRDRTVHVAYPNPRRIRPAHERPSPVTITRPS